MGFVDNNHWFLDSETVILLHILDPYILCCNWFSEHTSALPISDLIISFTRRRFYALYVMLFVETGTTAARGTISPNPNITTCLYLSFLFSFRSCSLYLCAKAFPRCTRMRNGFMFYVFCVPVFVYSCSSSFSILFQCAFECASCRVVRLVLLEIINVIMIAFNNWKTNVLTRRVEGGEGSRKVYDRNFTRCAHAHRRGLCGQRCSVLLLFEKEIKNGLIERNN